MIDFDNLKSRKISYIYKDLDKHNHQSLKVRQILYSREEIIRQLPTGLIMIEVGVWKGDFSKHMLKTNPKKLYLVDSWKTMTNDQQQSDEFQQIKEKVYDTLGKKNNVVIKEGNSVEVGKRFDDGSVDFAYIDADHSYPNVYNDIVTYASKIKSGGILMGHDWLNYPKKRFAVTFSVKKFLHENDDMYQFKGITNEEKFCSWIMIKK